MADMITSVTPSSNQIGGALDRAIVGLFNGSVTFMLAKHFIDETTAIFLGTAVFPVLSAAWGLFASREKLTLQRAAAVEGTTVVTKAALADATPQENIVSTTDVKVVPK